MTIDDTKFLGDPGIATNEGLLQRLAVSIQPRDFKNRVGLKLFIISKNYIILEIIFS
jgi:hypothetical protein